MDSLDHLGWVVEQSYEIADTQFGVRTNSEALAAWLENAFGEYRADEPTSPYYSLLVAENEGDSLGKRFHVVYEESRALVKTLDLREAVDTLVAQFEHVAARRRDDAVYVDAGLVTLDGVVALVPPILPPYLRTLGHRPLERSGLDLPVANYVALDPDTGYVVNTPPSVTPDPSSLVELDGLAPSSNGTGPRHAEARRPDAVYFLGMSEEPVVAASPGYAAHILASRILNLTELGGRAVETVGKLAERSVCSEIRSTTPKETLGTLVDHLRAIRP